MNPYKLLEDMKEVGFLSPFLFKSFSIMGMDYLNDWLLTVNTSNGSIYIRSTELGYAEFCIVLLSLPSSEEEEIFYICRALIEIHSECNGFTSMEEDSGKSVFFYHLTLPNSYTSESLLHFLSVLEEDCAIINKIFASLSEASDSIDLDKIENQINFNEEDEELDEDQDY